MGANCCVPVREKPAALQDDPRWEVSSCRNVRYSPSWSFRWDNRTHIEDIMDNTARFSRRGGRGGGDVVSEIKSATDTETEGPSREGSPLGAFEKSKAINKAGVAGNSRDGGADFGEVNRAPEPPRVTRRQGGSIFPPGMAAKVPIKESLVSNSFPEEKGTIKSGVCASTTNTNPSVSSSSTPSLSAYSLKSSSSRTRSLPPEPTSSRQARRSPGFQLSRQVSDSRIPSLKSLNENNSPDGRQSFVLSVSGNDLSMGGSQGGSSDGWSMRTFTDLVSSSQRERWSFDSESIKGKLPSLPSVTSNLQTCGVCSKLLKEKSPWSTQKIVSTNDFSVVAVLVCGHVYHAECLESMTTETDRFEPPCPICTHGEKPASKLLRKSELKARNKISRTSVADVDGNFDSISALQKGGSGPRMGTSSSLNSSFGRPFLRRHFSIGSRPTCSASENETKRKKGFWTRCRND